MYSVDQAFSHVHYTGSVWSERYLAYCRFSMEPAFSSAGSAKCRLSKVQAQHGASIVWWRFSGEQAFSNLQCRFSVDQAFSSVSPVQSKHSLPSIQCGAIALQCRFSVEQAFSRAGSVRSKHSTCIV
jgi:hypothetical protein